MNGRRRRTSAVRPTRRIHLRVTVYEREQVMQPNSADVQKCAAGGSAGDTSGTAPGKNIGLQIGDGQDELWATIHIPTFLLRGHPDCVCKPLPTAKPLAVAMPQTPQSVIAPAASGSDDSLSGSKPRSITDFSHFRVDPNEIEQKIKMEADRRWRNWRMTKTDRKRPTMRSLLKQVRKEFY